MVRPMLPLLTCALAGRLLIVAQQPSPPEEASEGIMHEVATPHGLLQAKKVYFKDGSDVNRVTIEDRTVWEDKDREYMYIDLEGSFPPGGPATVVLLELNTGGMVCPSFYMVGEVQADGSLRTTQRVGDCCDGAKVRWLGDSLRIDFPDCVEGPETWVYAKGTLTKAKPAPSARPKTRPHTK